MVLMPIYFGGAVVGWTRWGLIARVLGMFCILRHRLLSPRRPIHDLKYLFHVCTVSSQRLESLIKKKKKMLEY